MRIRTTIRTMGAVCTCEMVESARVKKHGEKKAHNEAVTKIDPDCVLHGRDSHRGLDHRRPYWGRA